MIEIERAQSLRWIAFVALAAAVGCGRRAVEMPTASRCGVDGEEVPYEGGMHLPEGTMITYGHNPPTSGPHYPIWAHYRAYDQPIPRPYWVHNLEHGALVLLYRPDAPPAAIAELRAAYARLPSDPECGHPRALLTPDPYLPSNVAAVVANFAVVRDRLDAATIATLASRCRNHGAEDVCADGAYP